MSEHDISNDCCGKGLGLSQISLLGLLLLLLNMVLPSAGQAGEVYGSIFISTGNQIKTLSPGDTFSVIINNNETRVIVSDKGNYRLLLAPGTYVVRYCDTNHQLWSAKIHSINGPLKQDIQLERRNNDTCR